MVASQKRRPGTSELAGQKRQVGLFLAVAAFIFFIGYSFGGTKAANSSEPTAKELHHQEDALERQQQECNKHHEQVMLAIGRLGEEEGQVQDTHVSLEQQNRDLRETHAGQETQMAECETELDLAKTRWSEDDHVLAAKIKSLAEETETMEELLRDLTEGHGMRQVLLVQALEKQRKRNAWVRSRLNLTDAPPTEAALVEKHNASIKTMDENIRASIDKRVNTSLTEWEKFTYVAENHTAIFIDNHDLYGNVIRPRYFNRLMQDVRPGILRVAPKPELSTLSERLLSFMKPVFCAYRNDNPNFTFPDAFAWRHAEDVEQLHDIIDTPLVTLCNNCVTHHRSKLFRDACRNDSLTRHYGSYDYWAARSMVRFQPTVENNAEAYITDHLMNPKTTLAVVYHASEKALQFCSSANRILPGPHYLMVRGGLSVDVVHSSDDTEMRCAPSLAYLEQRIMEVLAESAKQSQIGISSITTIYISNEPEALAALRKVDFGANVEVVAGEQHSAGQEAMDIVVAARMGYLLVSAYLPQSQVVTEQYLLNNAFDATHLNFF